MLTEFIHAFLRFENMNRLLSAAQIHPDIDQVFPFEQAREAYEYLSQRGHVEKVVIQVAKDDE
jgi:NADPH:quinone reductase-like Zn-dependent oxidoreductase